MQLFCQFIADLQVSSQEAYNTVSLLYGLVHTLIPNHVVCISTTRYRVESFDVKTCPFNEYSLTTGFLDLDTPMGERTYPISSPMMLACLGHLVGCHSLTSSLSFYMCI